MNRIAPSHTLALSVSLALLAGLASCQSTNSEPRAPQDERNASEDSREYQPHAQPASMKMDANLQERCQELSSQAHKLMADLKAQDAALAEQLRTMNASSEADKLGLLASIVSQMVEQRATLDVRMELLHQSMAQHMLQHMQAGASSSSQCPMIKSASSPVEARTSQS